MLNLFNILPDNFFQIFSGKNKEIYAHSLLILFDLFENDESLISRGDFIKTLKDKNKDLDTFTFEDEEFDDGDELILDNLSKSDTIPVNICSNTSSNIEHEATVSKINEDTLFYLMSRGISEERATELIILGFIDRFREELPMEYAVELNQLIKRNL